MDLSPYLSIAGIILVVYAGYSFLASRLVDERLLPPPTRNVMLIDVAVFGISFVLMIAGLVSAQRKDSLSWWAWAALVFGVPWAVALTLDVAFA